MSDADVSDLAPVSRLAEKLERDIQAKHLAPGDRYLTAAEAARELGVSTATANRAMRLLASRDVLSRERSRGTFIGPAVTPSPKCRVRTIVVFSWADDSKDVDFRSSAVLNAIRGEFGDVNVQFCTVPDHDSVAYAQATLEPMLAANQVGGAIAISCHREIYCYLAGLGVPLVIEGSLYSDAQVIPSVDADNKQAGRLLAKYLLKEGHRRLVLMGHNESLPGEHDFHDGVSEILAEMKQPATTLLLRQFPTDEPTLAAMLRHLTQMPDAPTGFICHGSAMAQVVARFIGNIKASSQRRPEIVCDCHTPTDGQSFPFVHAAPRTPLVEVERIVSGMLRVLSEGGCLEKDRVVIPVELRPPLK